jgi:stearoyl-CoA desaturase (delta-9 desaturase)
MVAFQHNNYLGCMVGSNIIAFFAVAWLFGDFVGAFVLAWWTRIFFLHHSTWFINSLAHTWGAQSFSQEHTAVDNYIISLLTFGEGYHNYHHTFANDYRNGIRWFHFDPTKWLIWVLNRCGLTYGLKCVNKYHIKERLLAEHKSEALAVLKASLIARREELGQTISTVSEDLTKKLACVREMVERYYTQKRSGSVSKDELKAHTKEIRSLKKSVREDWKHFRQLYKYVMRQGVGELPMAEKK